MARHFGGFDAFSGRNSGLSALRRPSFRSVGNGLRPDCRHLRCSPSGEFCCLPALAQSCPARFPTDVLQYHNLHLIPAGVRNPAKAVPGFGGGQTTRHSCCCKPRSNGRAAAPERMLNARCRHRCGKALAEFMRGRAPASCRGQGAETSRPLPSAVFAGRQADRPQLHCPLPSAPSQAGPMQSSCQVWANASRT